MPAHAAITSSVAALVALAEPVVFVAVMVTLILSPTSPATGV